MVPAFWNAIIRAEKGDFGVCGGGDRTVTATGGDGCGVRILDAAFALCGRGAEKIVVSVGATTVRVSLELREWPNVRSESKDGWICTCGRATRAMLGSRVKGHWAYAEPVYLFSDNQASVAVRGDVKEMWRRSRSSLSSSASKPLPPCNQVADVEEVEKRRRRRMVLASCLG